MFGRTIRVNLAKPMKNKEGSSRPGKTQLLLYLIIIIVLHFVLIQLTSLSLDLFKPFLAVYFCIQNFCHEIKNFFVY